MDQLTHFAGRLQSEPGFIAYHLAGVDVAARLGCTQRTAALLCICRVPRPGRRSEDVTAIAAHFGFDRSVLGDLLADVSL